MPGFPREYPPGVLEQVGTRAAHLATGRSPTLPSVISGSRKEQAALLFPGSPDYYGGPWNQLRVPLTSCVGAGVLLL